jgi:hypothetical protein
MCKRMSLYGRVVARFAGAVKLTCSMPARCLTLCALNAIVHVCSPMQVSRYLWP